MLFEHGLLTARELRLASNVTTTLPSHHFVCAGVHFFMVFITVKAAWTIMRRSVTFEQVILHVNHTRLLLTSPKVWTLLPPPRLSSK